MIPEKNPNKQTIILIAKFDDEKKSLICVTKPVDSYHLSSS